MLNQCCKNVDCPTRPDHLEMTQERGLSPLRLPLSPPQSPHLCLGGRGAHGLSLILPHQWLKQRMVDTIVLCACQKMSQWWATKEAPPWAVQRKM